VQDQDQNRFLWCQTGLILRPIGLRIRPVPRPVSDQVVYNSPTGTRIQLVTTWMDWLQLAPKNLGFSNKNTLGFF